VLIRAVEPIEGVEIMLERRKRTTNNFQRTTNLTTGPGALAQALGLTTKWTGQNFFSPDSPIWIENRGEKILENEIVSGKRIGVDYAGECAAWPWRFWLKNSPFVKKVNRA
jgi:DNA-3-methyladenine glycosylase